MLSAFYIFLLYFLNIVSCNSTETCEKHIPTGNFTSCSYQLWANETKDACQINRLGFNSCECQSALSETPTRNIPQRGTIKIKPYKEDRRTVFNITAYNITWTHFKIRFQQQNTDKCMKREFTIKKNVPKNKILYYDVAWASADIEDQIIDFEYAYGLDNYYDGKRSFLIRVPKYEVVDYFDSSHIKNLSLFTYVETTNLYQLACKIHAAPQHLHVTTYEINVFFKKSNNVTRIDGPFFKNAESAVFGVLDFEYDTYGIPGEYSFYVKPWNCDECMISTSPVVIIPETSTILTIGLVGVSCLIPIFLITLYMYFKVDSGATPRVLLITSPANNAHKKVGKALANLLIEKFNIPTMIDILDIPIPKIMPSDWLAKSFKCATHVIILMSDDKPVTCIYRNIDYLLCSLMPGDPDKICCTIEFPFTTKKVNLLFKVHRNFKLMQDYEAFINFIHNRGFLRRLVKKVMRNDLYYDLVRQIDEYKNGINCSADDCKEINIDMCDADDVYTAQNKMNILIKNEEEQQDVPETVQKCLNNCKSDSDDSDVEPTDSVHSLLKQ